VPDKQTQSRLEQYQASGRFIEMPPLSASYLVAYLFEIGPIFAGGMGEVGLPHYEIESWQRLSGIELQPWEVKVLRSASIAYAKQAQLAIKPECMPPWISEQYQEGVGNKVSRVFKSLVK
jgi:hypothetical protein